MKRSKPHRALLRSTLLLLLLLLLLLCFPAMPYLQRSPLPSIRNSRMDQAATSPAARRKVKVLSSAATSSSSSSSSSSSDGRSKDDVPSTLELLRFAGPALCIFLAAPLMSIVDTIFVGRIAG